MTSSTLTLSDWESSYTGNACVIGKYAIFTVLTCSLSEPPSDDVPHAVNNTVILASTAAIGMINFFNFISHSPPNDTVQPNALRFSLKSATSWLAILIWSTSTIISEPNSSFVPCAINSDTFSEPMTGA